MASPSDLISLSPKERRDYGFARVRDVAFDAVQSLWERRQSEGMTQADIAAAIQADPGWVSKNLRGPGNWTMRTFGAFVEALRGDVQVTVRGLEDPLPIRSNWHAYVGYDPATTAALVMVAKPIATGPSTTSSSGSPAAPRAMRPLVTTLTP